MYLYHIERKITIMRLKTQDITKAALLAAMLGVSAYITIPLGFTPISLTLQTLLVNMTAMLLTPSMSFMTILVYILVGLVGVPIFSGGAGGPAKLFGPTGGYILAFLIAAPVMSATKNIFFKLFRKFIRSDATAKITAYSVNAIIVGMVIIYAFGTAYMMLLLGKKVGEVLPLTVVPFIPIDIAKCIAAAAIAVPVIRALNKE